VRPLFKAARNTGRRAQKERGRPKPPRSIFGAQDLLPHCLSNNFLTTIARVLARFDQLDHSPLQQAVAPRKPLLASHVRGRGFPTLNDHPCTPPPHARTMPPATGERAARRARLDSRNQARWLPNSCSARQGTRAAVHATRHRFYRPLSEDRGSGRESASALMRARRRGDRRQSGRALGLQPPPLSPK
jgi:hypothetical protein